MIWPTLPFHLEKWFGAGRIKTYAVRDVSFAAHLGEMLYIVGPSGSGKTTLLSIISGILKPDSGAVLVEGKDIWGMSPGQIADFRLNTVGFVFQDYHLFPRLTTAENVAIPLLLKKQGWKESIDEAMKYLDAVGLTDRAQLPPVFSPASNPYAKGIYANGIVESYQTNGENINIFPEVAGVVKEIYVAEGQSVARGTPLLWIDDSVQRATVAQQQAQAEAALATLEELRAQPRKENLEVAKAQVDYAKANLVNLQSQLDKVAKSYQLNPNSVSKETLDNAVNAVKVARANLEVAQKQYELTKAGAWSYDIRNQEHQYRALVKANESSQALLDKYIIKAPADGIVLAIRIAVGSYVFSQGTYGTYTEGFDPVVVMGGSPNRLQVRCYIDEILVPRMTREPEITAKMFIRGTTIGVPLKFLRVQPYVTPKIQLSNERTERVDVRVLPVIFTFDNPRDMNIYPGQLVDVYLEEK